jgi:hypothetical protein
VNYIKFNQLDPALLWGLVTLLFPKPNISIILAVMDNIIMIILLEIEPCSSALALKIKLTSRLQMLFLYSADIFVPFLQDNSSNKSFYVTGAMLLNGQKEDCPFQDKMLQ